MIPWLLVLQVIAERGPLSALLEQRMRRFPVSGEINRRLTTDAKSILERIERRYAGSALALERTDGLSLEFPEWRFNLRGSNTEPLVRLNVESRASEALMREKTDEVLKLLEA